MNYKKLFKDKADGKIDDRMTIVFDNDSGSWSCDIDDEDKAEFLEAIGLTESGVDKLTRAAYHLLGLGTYFTAGEKEVRAWTFKRGIKAPQAAGIIHSDFERGFIRAVTMSYDDLMAYGSEKAVKEAGRLREEGKEYIVQDGDIMEFRFNV